MLMIYVFDQKEFQIYANIFILNTMATFIYKEFITWLKWPYYWILILTVKMCKLFAYFFFVNINLSTKTGFLIIIIYTGFSLISFFFFVSETSRKLDNRHNSKTKKRIYLKLLHRECEDGKCWEFILIESLQMNSNNLTYPLQYAECEIKSYFNVISYHSKW